MSNVTAKRVVDIATMEGPLVEKLRNKGYRDAFVEAHINVSIAAQIQTIRAAQGMTQKELAEKAGMKPARISVLEDPNYNMHSISTLRRLAAALDMGLLVKFVSVEELLAQDPAATQVQPDTQPEVKQE